MADAATVGIVILAAGSSRRLGRSKQLLRLHGRPLLQHVLDAAAEVAGAETVLVLGHEATRIEDAVTLPPHARIVRNPDHASGQASSLRAGIGALPPGVVRAVVLLSDQPHVTAGTIGAVAAGPGAITRARYRGGVEGHPVAFDRAVWPELLAIDGDRGARDVIARDPDRVGYVDVDAPAPADVDTADDARRMGAR